MAFPVWEVLRPLGASISGFVGDEELGQAVTPLRQKLPLAASKSNFRFTRESRLEPQHVRKARRDIRSRKSALDISRRCLGLRARENCNFNQFRSSPYSRKGRPKLTAYACLPLDDQRRSQELTHPDITHTNSSKGAPFLRMRTLRFR